jgi:Carbohydrate esterase, sialic acid-specific acetylesterase
LIRRVALVAAVAAACIACLLVGMHSGSRGDEMFRVSRDVKRWLLPTPEYNAYTQLVAYPYRREIARPPITPRTMVAFVFGQSNSANHGDEKFRAPSPAVANFWNGKYFAAEDPLLGASGDGGSPWTLMANEVIGAGAFGGVILIAAGVGSTSVQAWTTGDTLNGMLEERLAETKAAGLTVTHFLWHQGESDNSAAGAVDYDAAMQPIIALTKRYFPQSKFFVAQATLCGPDSVPNVELQKIQLGLSRLPGVFAGPNTDEIGFADRSDGCHMSGSGLKKHAAGWAAAIAAHRD